MKITLVTFASLKEFLPADTEITIEQQATISELRRELVQRIPAIANILKSSRFAVMEALVDDETVLHEHEIVYIIPPSSGG
ncbi:MAG TPA: MoaD/ThiS family protein [Bacteroidota bacterium]|nr:MoaD/ThiS family protein [Bacteroidota bacterium]